MPPAPEWPSSLWNAVTAPRAAAAPLRGTIEADAVVVGGGITGAGVAREAAGSGLRTLLVEQKDFSWGTSSRSSKMVHGGLRYLGSGHYGLTRDAVRERERLGGDAPVNRRLVEIARDIERGALPADPANLELLQGLL